MTLVASAALWTVGGVTGSVLTGPDGPLLGHVGVGVDSLAAGRWWTPVSSMFFSSGLVGYIAITALLLLGCAPLERRIGTTRAAVALVASQTIGTLAATGIVSFAARTGDTWAGQLAGVLTVGMSPGACGLLLTGSVALQRLWRRRVRVGAVAVLLATTLYAGDFSDIARLAAGIAGLAGGVMYLAAMRPRPPLRQPIGDRRVLTALCVAAAATGPLSTIMAEHRYGPLSALNFMFLPSLDADDVVHWCARISPAAQGECAARATAFLVQGIGPLFQTLLPTLVLLVLAEGLRRGRRSAYMATIIANLSLAAIGFAQSRAEMVDLAEDTAGRLTAHSEFWVVRLAPVALPLAIIALVVASRDEFRVRMPWRVHRRWVAVTVVAGAVTCAVYLVAGSVARSQFRPEPSLANLVASLPARFAPAGYLGSAHGHFFPVGPLATALYIWTGAAFWAVVLIATVAHFRRCRSIDTDPDRQAAERVVRASGGGSSLGYMTLWGGNHYHLSPDESTFVAYRVIAGVAITTGDPVGPHRAAAIDGFVAYCAAAGWAPCFFSVSERTTMLLRSYGYHALHVASEAFIDLADLSFTGKKWQDIRTSLNRARRDGIRAVSSTYPQLDPGLAAQVAAIDQQWLAGKALPEMGFTLGGLAELNDPNVRCILAVDPANHVLAVTSWLPAYRDGQSIGWTLDFMRRGDDAFPGAMEFLIATALTTMREEGATWVSLSGAPLAWPDGAGPEGPIGSAMTTLSSLLEPVYGFRSLLAFKKKFHPMFRPLFLCYPTAASLPAATNAVLRAYVPHTSATETLTVLSRLTRSAIRSQRRGETRAQRAPAATSTSPPD